MTTKSQSPLKSIQKNKIINLININSLHTNTQGACGYCQGKTPDRYWVTSGFECDQMGLQEYKQLLDRGWRRCGQYYYKPHIESCCCQPYPIRTNILQFKALQRNSFKERIKKLDKFLNYQENNYQNDGKKQKLNDTISSDSQHEEDNEMENDEIQKIKEYQKDINEYYQQMYCILVQFHKCMQEFYPKYEKQFQELLKTDKDLKHQLNIMWEVGPTTLKKTDNIKQIGMKSHKSNTLYILFQLLKKDLKLKLPKIDIFTKLVEDLNLKICQDLIEQNQQDFGNLLISMKHGSICFSLKDREETLKKITYIYDQEQQRKNSINLKKQRDKMEKNQNVNNYIPVKRRNLVRQIVPARFEEETFQLYKQYLSKIHHKSKTSKQSFKNFLCTNALVSERSVGKLDKIMEYGCFHFKYYIDDELMFVSVVDILPGCMSLVYNFYHPSLRKYSIGIIGSLKDIQYMEDQQKYFPEFKYYYQGYYIGDSNSKMQYKADYLPCEFLCPVTYNWVQFSEKESIKEAIQNNKDPQGKIYDDIQNEEDSAESKKNEIIQLKEFVQKQMQIYLSGKYVRISDIRQSYAPYYESLLIKIVSLMGKDLAKKVIFGQI